MLWKLIRPLVFTGAMTLVLVGSWFNTNSSAAIIFLGDSVKLSSLTGNTEASIVAGDKKFSGFGYDYTGDMPTADGVNVRPIWDDLDDTDPNTGNYGIRFTGAFVDLPSSPGGSDANISYMVEATDPGKLISDAHLSGNPALLGEFGSMSVVETFLPLGANGEHTMSIFDDESVPTPKLVDWTFFNPPVRKLNVVKDILAIATDGSQTATLSYVDQTFSQVPEPVTAAMAMLATVGLGLFVRRRESK